MVEVETNNINLLKENLKSNGPAMIAVSGPSGAGKDYLTDKAVQHFDSVGIPSFNVQMTTERAHRGEVETKICITPEEYTRLQEENKLIGDHINVVRYGYRKEDVIKAVNRAREEGGIVILELNPAKQAHFTLELQEGMGLELTAWIGVATTEQQTADNMRERGETEETIRARVSLIHEFNEAMENNSEITLVDNGPDNRVNSPQDFINVISTSILSRR